MSAQPAQPQEPYEKIHLGGEEAAIVPIGRLRHLEAVERHTPDEVIAAAEAEEAKIEASIARHRAWLAAGCPNAEDHEDVKRELLAELGL